jgi:integrase
MFFKPFFEEQRIHDIREIHDMTIKSFHSYIKRKDFSDKYRYNIMNMLKEFLHFHRASISKMPEFPTITVQKPPIKWLDEKQQDEVFSCIPSQDLPIFIFMRYTGCRPNEAGGLLRENVFWNHSAPYLVLATVLRKDGTVKPNTKTKIAKPLPIIEEMTDALKPKEATPFIFSKWGRPYTHHRLRHIWDDAVQEANVKYGTPIVSLYSGLKHSFGCQRINDGFSVYQIKEVFGHTDIKTTERYAQYATAKLADVMKGKVRPILGAKVVHSQSMGSK